MLYLLFGDPSCLSLRIRIHLFQVRFTLLKNYVQKTYVFCLLNHLPCLLLPILHHHHLLLPLLYQLSRLFLYNLNLLYKGKRKHNSVRYDQTRKLGINIYLIIITFNFNQTTTEIKQVKLCC